MKNPINIIQTIILESHSLVEIYLSTYKFRINYLTIFAQTEQEYGDFNAFFAKAGISEETNNGIKYKLNRPIDFHDETISNIRIRKHDLHKHEYGCVDLVALSGMYEIFKEIALAKGLDIIIRKDYEMIELADFKINTLAYIVQDY